MRIATGILLLLCRADIGQAFAPIVGIGGSPHFVQRTPSTRLSQPASPLSALVVEDETKKTTPDKELASGDGSSSSSSSKEKVAVMSEEEMVHEVEMAVDEALEEMMEERCQVDLETGQPADELCLDGEEKTRFRDKLKSVMKQTLNMVRGVDTTSPDDATLSEGERLEKGWEKRANSSSLIRNAEVWKFALKSVFRALKPRKLRAKGASDDEIQKAQVEAAEYIRDGLLLLGPSFVKLGQVASTRTDVLPKTYTDVLKTLTDEVPGFSGTRAKEIVSEELGRPFDEIFTDFSDDPLKAASLGQVHTAYYKGQKVAIKVQRAGLKELFDIDLKNLKKLAVLLDKFDPKSDGADRDWVKIYEESERLLYLEIDYLNEVRNTERFQKDFKDIDYVKIPNVIREVTTPRVLTMEFVESFKLTDIAQVEQCGLDRKVLAKQVADTFLRQIIETAYFHADPHSYVMCLVAGELTLVFVRHGADEFFLSHFFVVAHFL